MSKETLFSKIKESPYVVSEEMIDKAKKLAEIGSGLAVEIIETSFDKKADAIISSFEDKPPSDDKDKSGSSG